MGRTASRDWAAALAEPDARLHLYGKAEARPGRKMGHLTVLGDVARRGRRWRCGAVDACRDRAVHTLTPTSWPMP